MRPATGKAHAGGFISPADVNALVMIAITFTAPRVSSNFGASAFPVRISTRSSGMISIRSSGASRTCAAAPGL